MENETMKTNMDLRLLARANGVPLWKIAAALNVGEATLFRWLRTEIPEGDKRRTWIINAIEEISLRKRFYNLDEVKKEVGK